MPFYNELKTLRNLRPCVGQDVLLRIDNGRLENVDLPTDAKYPLMLPARHALTRLTVFAELAKVGHAGLSKTLYEHSAAILDNS